MSLMGKKGLLQIRNTDFFIFMMTTFIFVMTTFKKNILLFIVL